jgi:N6-adenosine-specific RNA methylase IME4
VADPPWNYSKKLSGGGTSGFARVHHSKGGSRGAANHYSTLTVDELRTLGVGAVAADRAHLYLWTTGAFMAEAHDIAQAWGFAPKGVIPWIKVRRDAARHVSRANGDLHEALRMGMGRYYRWCTEFVLFGVRGKLPLLRRDLLGAFFAERGAHSAKPDRFFELVEQASPGPRLELFARMQRPGYVAWGDQIDSEIDFTRQAASTTRDDLERLFSSTRRGYQWS